MDLKPTPLIEIFKQLYWNVRKHSDPMGVISVTLKGHCFDRLLAEGDSLRIIPRQYEEEYPIQHAEICGIKIFREPQ